MPAALNDRAAAYGLFVLFCVNAMNFYDRQILGALAEPIKEEWKLSDQALGGLGTAFVLLYAVAGLPLGMLSDHFRRTRILAVGVFFWSLMTGASGLAWSYWSLFAARLAVGVGEASCAPAASSLIGDYFPATGRARALSLFMMGLPIGTALSFLASAYIAQQFNWRWALFVAFLPGLLCMVAAWFMQEPARGQTEQHGVGARRRPGRPFVVVLSIPTMWWIILSGALHNFNMYAFGSFLPSFLRRVHGLTVFQAGAVTALVYGLVGTLGLVAGGTLGDWALRRSRFGRMLVGAVAIALGTPCLFFALQMTTVWRFAALMALGCGTLYVYYSTVYATIHDIVEPALRGTAMSLYFFAMYVLGAALGPFATGYLSDHFARAAAIKAGVNLSELTGAGLAEALKPYSATGLHTAMYVIPILCGVLALVLFAAALTVSRDVDKLQRWMRETS